MRSDSREEITAAFDALDASLDGVLGLDFDALTTPERLALLERCEKLRRRLPAAEHPLINELATRPPQKSWAANSPMRSPSGH